MVESFGKYLWSFLDNWFFWIGIVMLIGELVERKWGWLKERLEKYAPRWVFAGLALLCFFLAGFQKWYEEHEKVESQRTYIRVGGPGNTAIAQFVKGTRPYISLEETNGDFIAQNVKESAELMVVDAPHPNAPPDAILAKQVEEGIFEDFRSKAVDVNTREDMEPHSDYNIGAALDHPLSDDEVSELTKPQPAKLMIFVGYVAWTDVAGRHAREICQIVMGVMNSKLLTHGCVVHDQYIDRADQFGY